MVKFWLVYYVGRCTYQCRVNANRGPWQLFRPAINTAHFFVAEVMSNYLTTDGLKKFSLLQEAPLGPEARGICHICDMVNRALAGTYV